MIDVALGGRAAEDLIFGHDDVTSGCSSDLQRATDVATRMIRVRLLTAIQVQLLIRRRIMALVTRSG